MHEGPEVSAEVLRYSVFYTSLLPNALGRREVDHPCERSVGVYSADWLEGFVTLMHVRDRKMAFGSHTSRPQDVHQWQGKIGSYGTEYQDFIDE